MWICSPETVDVMVGKKDIEREPHLYPKEIVEALGRIEEMESIEMGSSMEPEFRFAYEGWIIQDCGLVGLRPGASDLAKKEWMNYWEACKALPCGII